MDREKIIIIDGSGYFFRAFFAIQRLTTSKGFPTNAIYGFINMLARVLEVEKPTKLAIAFDTARPSFRKERYAEYKANREAPPEDLVKQIPHILRSVDCFGIKRFELGGFEADDVIGTFARQAVAGGFRVEIITGDKDLMQLVDDNVTLFDTMKDKRVDTAGVVEKFGVKPEQIVDFLALMGDSSDNIPGVNGIGEKTASELIRTYGSLDGLYSRIEEIKQQKRRETLIAEKDIAYLSRELATVRTDIPLDFKWNDLNYQGPINEKLRAFCEEFEFQGLIKRFSLKTEETAYQKGKYETVSTPHRLLEVVENLKKAPIVSVDTETTSLAIHDASVVGISLTGREGEAYYIPLGHHALGHPSERIEGQIDEVEARTLLKPLLEDPKIPKVGQHLKYDWQILRRWGVDLQGIASDTLLASYLIDPDQPHNLDSLAFRYLGHQNITYEDVTGKGKLQISFSEVTVEKATDYSGEDVDVTLRLHHKLLPEVEGHHMSKLYTDVEIPLIEVLGDMEYRGVLIDESALKEMSLSLEKEIDSVQEKIHELAGEPVNINSPKQLSTILFEKLKLPVIRRTKTGISTDESVLIALCDKHPICSWILKSREYGKLKSTYVDGLLGQIHSQTHRVHTSYNQTVTATGRLSSSNPNLQNIPASSDPRYDIRAVFVASPGSTLLSADYSQVELRLLAEMSKDKALVNAFQKDEDIHEVTARLIFGIQGNDPVSSDKRKVAKTINFGVIYGQTPFGLSQQLGITPKEAKAFIGTYFEKYSGIRSFLTGLAETAREKGYATTLLGRRRYLPEITSQNRMRREMAERAAINAPLQGTAADMIKIAMVRLHQRLRAEGLKSKMILQVHDELVLEVAEGERTKAEAALRECMEQALSTQVPLKVDVGWGNNWRECG